MNKKGFTLIELLSTIAIMTIIATVLTVNVLNIFDNKQKITNHTKQNIITTPRKLY